MTDDKYFYKGIRHELITPGFLKANDGKLVWIRDDYLMCSPMVKASNPELYDLLEHVYAVKEAAKKSGIQFEN